MEPDKIMKIFLKPILKKFLFPAMTRKYLIRVSLVIVSAFLFFNFICVPFRIKGYSMMPTYQNGELNFCFRPRYLFSTPDRHDVVAIRLAGQSIMLLKRVVGLEGDIVEFCKGKLFINGEETDEAYVRYPWDWNLPPRKVVKDHVYVLGDNRHVPIHIHQFGQTPVNRIIGEPLWKK
jgi:signal peptidase I